jgi:serine/threonine protein kinase
MLGVTSLPAGALFADDFEILRPLSAGGMGTLYVARQKSTGKERALKLMLLQLAQNTELRRRFEQEARIASLIRSDHVVEVVGAGVDEASGVPWLAMELLEGTDLAAAIARRGPMTLDETGVILEQLCHALAAAHAAGIIHRDLKPENVFLSKGRSAQAGQVVKVLDFGIAKIAEEAATNHTAAMGSPLWMAPEQSERGAVTPAADVWAIGLLAFFLLTGRPFWRAAAAPEASVRQIMREVLFDPIPLPSERAREHGLPGLLPRWFDPWFALCVTRDVSARLSNAGEVYALFRRLCAEPGAASLMPAAISSASVVVRPPTPADLATASDETSPTGPTLFAADPTPPGGPTGLAAGLRRKVPSVVVAAGLAVLASMLAAAVILMVRQAQPPIARAGQAPDSLSGLPRELAVTPGAAWFNRVHARCNPVAVDLLQTQDPPPKTKDGAGFAAACLTLAGKHDRARAAVDALKKDDRSYAAWAVFEVIHPIADAGDDNSTAPGMLLVLDYWPANYMALYHAGMSEYRTDQPVAAYAHLQNFVALYKTPDGFNAAAHAALVELDRRGAPGDCASPITVDPEGKRVFPLGCKPAR